MFLFLSLFPLLYFPPTHGVGRTMQSFALTPFRLQCPPKQAITSMKIQHVTANLRGNSDLMFTVHCDSMDDMVPRKEVLLEVERCRWTQQRSIHEEMTFDEICIDNEYLAGLSRISVELDMMSLMCCKLTAMERSRCKEIQLPMPGDTEREIVMADSGFILHSLAMRDKSKNMAAKLCKFSQIEVEYDYENIFVPMNNTETTTPEPTEPVTDYDPFEFETTSTASTTKALSIDDILDDIEDQTTPPPQSEIDAALAEVLKEIEELRRASNRTVRRNSTEAQSSELRSGKMKGKTKKPMSRVVQLNDSLEATTPESGSEEPEESQEGESIETVGESGEESGDSGAEIGSTSVETTGEGASNRTNRTEPVLSSSSEAPLNVSEERSQTTTREPPEAVTAPSNGSAELVTVAPEVNLTTTVNVTAEAEATTVATSLEPAPTNASTIADSAERTTNSTAASSAATTQEPQNATEASAVSPNVTSALTTGAPNVTSATNREGESVESTSTQNRTMSSETSTELPPESGSREAVDQTSAEGTSGNRSQEGSLTESSSGQEANTTARTAAQNATTSVPTSSSDVQNATTATTGDSAESAATSTTISEAQNITSGVDVQNATTSTDDSDSQSETSATGASSQNVTEVPKKVTEEVRRSPRNESISGEEGDKDLGKNHVRIKAGILLCRFEESLIHEGTGLHIACGDLQSIWFPARCPESHICSTVLELDHLVCCPGDGSARLL